MRSRIALFLGVLGAVAALARPAGQDAVQAPTTAGELLVTYETGVDSFGRQIALRSQGAVLVRHFEQIGVDFVRVDQSRNLDTVAAALEALPTVRAVQPNYIRTIVAPPPPNDPSWLNDSLWGLLKIQAQPVWTNYTVGNPAIIVADVDTGVNYTHPDLAANMWTNPGEIAGNGVDDDLNGYIDDVYGIDTINNDSNPFDDNGHGTHTAGTIAGVGNNGVGVVGVSWNTKILACKFLSAGGSGTDAGAIACFNYILALKNRGINIRATNNSWGGSRGGGGVPVAMQNAINALGNAGIINIFAAGNNGANNDVSPFDPASIPAASIVSVAASTQTDARASFSNYGLTSVDLAAPGVGILSTYLGTGYASLNGTSMAAPHVAGAAALLLAMNDSLSVDALKTLIMNSGDIIPAWNGLTVTGRRLNVLTAAQSLGNAPPTVNLTSPSNGASFVAPATINLAANAADADGSVTQVEFRANGSPIGVDPTAPYTFSWTNVPVGSYALTAVATDDDGATTTSAPVNVTVTPPGGGGASATFLASDSTTQGNWIGTFGGDGHSIVGDTTSLPSYATLNAVGAQTYQWWSGTSGDVRATQRSSGSGRVAATWYAETFDLDVNIGDGQTHEITLYNLDWDASGGRSQRIDVLNAATLEVLDTRTISAFNGGRHLTWLIGGGVKFRVTRLGVLNAVVSAVFFDSGSGGNVPPNVSLTAPSPGASFVAPATVNLAATASDPDGTVTLVEFFANGNLVGSDATAPYQATWSNVGPGSYSLTAMAHDDDGATRTSAAVPITVSGSNVPPTVSLTSPSPGASFVAPATVPLAANAADSDGTVTQVEFFANGGSIGIDTVAPYAINWSGVPAGSYSLTAVATDDDGATTTSSPVNITVTPGGGGATATFVGLDAATQGDWIGTYGSDGYSIVADTTSLPSYATLTPAGAQTYQWWSGTSGDRRATQRALGGGRVAATWYAETFDLDVQINDGQEHAVTLYNLDWDAGGTRSQRIDVLDAATLQVLDSRTVTAFNGGQLLTWNITGNVRFRVTRLGALNAVIAAIFFDGAQQQDGPPPAVLPRR